VASDEAGPVHQVGGGDRLRAEAEVRDGARAGLLGVVDEVALGVRALARPEDLDRVLVGAHRAVRAEPVEDGPHRLRVLHVQVGGVGEREVGDVVGDPHGETRARGGQGELVEDPLDHAGGELLRGQPVASADHEGHALAPAGAHRLAEGRDHVEEQRLAPRAGFLRAVQDGDPGGARREGGQDVVDGEGTVEAQLHHADLLAPRPEVFDRLLHGLRTRAHDDDDALRVGVAQVLDEPVGPAGERGEPVHRVADDAGGGRVEGVDRLAGLEVGVRVLGSAPDVGVLRAQCTSAVLPDRVLRHQGTQLVVGQHRHRVQLVAGAEPVEEVHERHPRAEGRHLGDGRHVVALLHAGGGEEREAGLAHGHHVLVVPEDGQPLRGQRPGGDVQHHRGEFAGDLVHVGDHEEQPLGGREGGGERATLQGAVQRAGRAALGLHLDDGRNRAVDVLPVLRGPLVRQFRHRGAGGDGVDRAQLVEAVGDGGRGLVAVDDRGHGVSPQRSAIISMAWTGHCS